MSGTTGIVTFDYSMWVLRYPEFGTVPAQLAGMYFGEACALLDNTSASPIGDTGLRTTYLNMITAHIAALNMPGSSPIVGHINSASEGSVSVSAEVGEVAGSKAYWYQTKYGIAYYTATAGARFGFYVPGVAPCAPSYLPGCIGFPPPYIPGW